MTINKQNCFFIIQSKVNWPKPREEYRSRIKKNVRMSRFE